MRIDYFKIMIVRASFMFSLTLLYCGHFIFKKLLVNDFILLSSFSIVTFAWITQSDYITFIENNELIIHCGKFG